MKRLDNFKAGFINENPIFGLYLGLCSALAISTTLNNAIGMGVAATLVLVMSNVIISCIRKITPDEIRIPVYIVVIAALVKMVQMLVQAYAPDLYNALGIFLPLIVVNCIILGRAEAFASKNGVVDSLIDGLGMGLGYTVGLIVLSTVRQILSTGMLSFANPFNTNLVIFQTTFFPKEFAISMFKDSIGAFFTFACLAAALTAYKSSENKKTWHRGAGIVGLVLVAFIALRSDFMVDNTPVKNEPKPTPVVNKVNMENTNAKEFNAEVVSKTDNGDGSITVVVSCEGYAFTDPAKYPNPERNTFDVTVKDGAVVSVTVSKCSDTPYVGDKIMDANFLAQFAGLTTDTLEVDVAGSATISTASTVKAVYTALEATK